MDKQEIGIGSPPGRQYAGPASLNAPDFGLRRFLVIADDLTGAADAAVALAGARHSAEIFLDPGRARGTDNVVTAVDLDTRRMGAAEAARAVEDFFTTMPAHDALLFKKLDSTLRGHIGAELDALQRAIASQRTPGQPPTLCIVAPAHPTQGRAFINGRLELKDAAAKPGGQGPPGSLPSPEAMPIRSQLESFGFGCTGLTIENLRDPDIQATAKLVRHAAAGAKPALLCDARTEDDMRRIVTAASASGARCIWAGSGGLASALNEFLSGPSHAENRSCPAHKTSPGSTLFLVGSFSAIARQQIRELSKTAQVHCLPLTLDELAGHPGHSERLIDRAIANQRDVAIYIDPEQSIRPDLSPAFAAHMAALIAPKLGQLGALICCGGDTTRALFDKTQLTHLQAHKTHEPGVTHVYSRNWPQLPILIKAGAFGDAQTLLRLRHHLEPS